MRLQNADAKCGASSETNPPESWLNREGKAIHWA